MKKILLIMAVLAGFITSCSNEDIDIIHSGGLTVNVSTQQTFDDFQATQYIKEKFLSKGWKVGVYNFIYNKDGSLVVSDSTYVSTFSQVSFNYDKLVSGAYDVITLEMIVNPDMDYAPNNWVILGKEDIKTIEISTRYLDAYAWDIVGLNSCEININGQMDQTISLIPKGIGSLINVDFCNFDKSPYNKLSFYTKDYVLGRYLSPYYEGNSRFEYDRYAATREWYLRGTEESLGGFEDSLELKIYLIEEGQITYCYGIKESQADGTFGENFYPYPYEGVDFNITDGASYYGGLWYTGGNPICQFGLFNTKTEYDLWYSTMYQATNSIIYPYLIWGADSSAVNTYMSNNGMEFAGSGTQEGFYWTVYINSIGTIGYEYHFDTSKTNLNISFMGFYASTLEEVKNYLSKSFEGGEYDEVLGGYRYHSDEANLLAYEVESEDGTYVEVGFWPKESTSNVSIIDNIDKQKWMRWDKMLKTRSSCNYLKALKSHLRVKQINSK